MGNPILAALALAAFFVCAVTTGIICIMWLVERYFIPQPMNDHIYEEATGDEEFRFKMACATPEERSAIIANMPVREVRRHRNDWRTTADMCGMEDGQINGLGQRRWERVGNSLCIGGVCVKHGPIPPRPPLPGCKKLEDCA